jgi:hypothetical protein
LREGDSRSSRISLFHLTSVFASEFRRSQSANRLYSSAMRSNSLRESGVAETAACQRPSNSSEL